MGTLHGHSRSRLKPIGVLACAILLMGTSALWAAAAPKLAWHDLASWDVEGKGWTDTKQRYDRLPAKAEGVVRGPVWSLAQDSAGLRFRFVTDAAEISARWTLRKGDRLALPHMPATGVSGLDLYVRDAGRWKWIGAGRPEKATNERSLVRGLTPGVKREYLLYLPLYNGVAAIELGVPEGTTLERAPDRDAGRKPVVFYGTSILQGGCASRPGMAYPAIVGRLLDWPTINLGFSGNGKSEPEMAQLFAELDPAAYVLDSLPNLDVAQVKERVEPFVRTLRAARPTTPIVLVENVSYADAGFVESKRRKVADANAYLRGLYDRLKKAGDKHLFYVPASHLLGADGDDTVDGVHPTDLGFQRMAQGAAPFIREAMVASGATVTDEEGFVALFDGKTLNGWTQHDGMPPLHLAGKWWVEDGQLLGTQDPPGKGGLLWVDRPFTDFILKLQVKLTYPMDTGIFVRVGPDGRSHQITLDYRPGSDVGAIFIPFIGHAYVQRNPEGARLVRNGDWNDVEVRMEGEPARIRVWMNDRLLTDFQHTEQTTRGVPAQGGIALQVHPDVPNLTVWKAGESVRFRNIRIRELK
ncbi:SGNH/GDSL hydrolase family protein [Horticoccus sp. 23ND18S-11]|uniref:SGNH/GDSL hydrolase family protein n=1 Tax=Horticoccus sp. 23ND18S-11 TaxID=3391832 RepID=UPI0039C9F037